MKKVELLAPVGDMTCLRAAINAGCDAVYLAGKLFGARAFINNFNDDELIEAIKYAHLHGVKVYLTVNTIIYEREVENFIKYIRFVHENNIDAVIIEDLGMLDLIRKKFPNLEVHASTQMHIHNYEGALFAKKMGVKRIVIARETPLDVIKKIKDEIDIEVETFIHGALCVSYSGQCLMSSLIGNRSGNRGTCAQCCRKKYDLYDLDGRKLNNDEYLLSMKDLCTLEYVDKIISSGVDSLKIEGRVKRPSYVYIVTSIYRKVIDNYYKYGKLKIDEADIIDLKKIFNRCFTKGFIMNEENKLIVNQKRPNHMGVSLGKIVGFKNGYIDIKLEDKLNIHDGLRIIGKEDKGLVVNKMFINKKEVNSAKCGDIVSIKYNEKVTIGSKVILTTDSFRIKEIDDILKEDIRKVKVDIEVSAKIKNKMIIKVHDGKNTVTLPSLFTIEEAFKNPTTKDMIEKQITKLGGTIYSVGSIKLDVSDNIFINIKDINELRREVFKKLDEKRLYNIEFIEKDYEISVPSFKKENLRSILINTKEEYEKYKDKYDILYTNDKALLLDDKCVLKIPRVNSKYTSYSGKVLIGEVGSLLKYDDFATDFSFNVVNSYTVSFLHSIGAKRVTLSSELNTTQIKNIVDSYYKRTNKYPNLEVINKGYMEAMICKFDLNKMYGIKVGYLKDEFNNKYKIVSSDCYMTIYNYKKIDEIPDSCYYDIGINVLRNNNLI